jgi:hypothetical protein
MFQAAVSIYCFTHSWLFGGQRRPQSNDAALGDGTIYLLQPRFPRARFSHVFDRSHIPLIGSIIGYSVSPYPNSPSPQVICPYSGKGD